jgi:hypothetical protein
MSHGRRRNNRRNRNKKGRGQSWLEPT